MPGQEESSATMRVILFKEARMRGDDRQQGAMYSYISPEARVPQDHPLRAIRGLVDAVLRELSPRFAELYAGVGRPSIPPEQLLRAKSFKILYTTRSERQLMEHLDYNLLFRGFVGLNMEEPVWDPTVFTKNRQRLLDGEVATAFLERVVALAQQRRLLSGEHFTVDGTLIEAWASVKSFTRKDGPPRPPDNPGNPTVNFHGDRRSNLTHASTTNPEARPVRKGDGQEAKLGYQGHALMDNRHGLGVNACATQASGTAEWEAAGQMVTALPRAVALGADKGDDTREFVKVLRALAVTPHVAQNTSNRASGIDDRTTRHPGYLVSQQKRKLVEEIFGWLKTVGLLRK